MRDMHSNVKVVKAIDPQTVSTTGASNGRLSAAIDRRGYESVEFVMARGVSAAATDTINPVILEGDTTGGSFTSVADASLVGTEASAVMTGATGGVSKVGYVGNKRYLKIRLYGLGTATAIVSAQAVLGHGNIAPPVA